MKEKCEICGLPILKSTPAHLLEKVEDFDLPTDLGFEMGRNMNLTQRFQHSDSARK